LPDLLHRAAALQTLAALKRCAICGYLAPPLDPTACRICCTCWRISSSFARSIFTEPFLLLSLLADADADPDVPAVAEVAEPLLLAEDVPSASSRMRSIASRWLWTSADEALLELAVPVVPVVCPLGLVWPLGLV
jgi:hypothetical protein